jgi:hypothetical protein
VCGGGWPFTLPAFTCVQVAGFRGVWTTQTATTESTRERVPRRGRLGELLGEIRPGATGGRGVLAKNVKIASHDAADRSATLLGLSPRGSPGAGVNHVGGGMRDGLGPGKKTLIEDFKGLSPFGHASLKVA